MFATIDPPSPKDFLYYVFLVLCLGLYEYQSVRHPVADAASYISVIPQKISPFGPVYDHAYPSGSRHKPYLIAHWEWISGCWFIHGNEAHLRN